MQFYKYVGYFYKMINKLLKCYCSGEFQWKNNLRLPLRDFFKRDWFLCYEKKMNIYVFLSGCENGLISARVNNWNDIWNNSDFFDNTGDNYFC